ncbi:MAG: C4-type zinc ribbon domain-containing protein [candidate division KSB1 bacterium]|nr:C4-type zinc ribbon domain-containing protein [candidate division KSB1 bacterium]MDZ7317577.1 C4-type zinc ribbon domain-containing protein [candidate division KSB1 bacterium]MDZ7340184.1 C4-type zinc ribbon domain-containing protein [candidate division KSB1 bacterium]
MDNTNKSQLIKLVRLQEIDKRLMELDALTGDIPVQVEKLRNRLAEVRDNLTRCQNELTATQKMNRTIDNDIQLLSDKLSKYKEQLFSVKTNKEYDAITVEIENLENKLTEMTQKGVETIEQEEKLVADVTQQQQQYAEVEQQLQERETELAQKLQVTAAEQQQLQGQRETIVRDIDRRYLANYERIRKGRHGVALAYIDNYTCSGCFATIPAQTVVEVRQMNRLITCETCGRILVLLNGNAQGKPAVDTMVNPAAR